MQRGTALHSEASTKLALTKRGDVAHNYVMVFGFHSPREIGEVFLPALIALHDGSRVEPQPIRIVREATIEEWQMEGGSTDGKVPSHFYEISTD